RPGRCGWRRRTSGFGSGHGRGGGGGGRHVDVHPEDVGGLLRDDLQAADDLFVGLAHPAVRGVEFGGQTGAVLGEVVGEAGQAVQRAGDGVAGGQLVRVGGGASPEQRGGRVVVQPAGALRQAL